MKKNVKKINKTLCLEVGEFLYCIKDYKLNLTNYKGTFFLNELTGDNTLFEKGKYYEIIEYEEYKGLKFWRIKFGENPDPKPPKSIKFRDKILSQYFCCTLKEYRKLKMEKLSEKI